jgi:hypothetical protein
MAGKTLKPSIVVIGNRNIDDAGFILRGVGWHGLAQDPVWYLHWLQERYINWYHGLMSDGDG